MLPSESIIYTKYYIHKVAKKCCLQGDRAGKSVNSLPTSQNCFPCYNGENCIIVRQKRKHFAFCKINHKNSTISHKRTEICFRCEQTEKSVVWPQKAKNSCYQKLRLKTAQFSKKTGEKTFSVR